MSICYQVHGVSPNQKRVCRARLPETLHTRRMSHDRYEVASILPRLLLFGKWSTATARVFLRQRSGA